MKRTGVIVALCASLVAAAPAHAAVAGAQRTHTRIAPRRHTIATAAARFARRFVGVPYAWGGSTPAGFDCSGFTRFVYAHFGLDLPHSSYAQWDLGPHPRRAGLRPGDIVFFGLGHVGIWLGHDRFIHAPQTGERVHVERLTGWYGRAYTGAVRLRRAQRRWPPARAGGPIPAAVRAMLRRAGWTLRPPGGSPS